MPSEKGGAGVEAEFQLPIKLRLGMMSAPSVAMGELNAAAMQTAAISVVATSVGLTKLTKRPHRGGLMNDAHDE